jgi:4-hydroxy-tetrahydrodipicolinate synthase
MKTQQRHYVHGTMSDVRGLFAAIPTPVRDDGRPDHATVERMIEFVVDAGVDGVCIGGATGEYPHFETPEREAVIRRVSQRLPRDRTLLVGIGAPSMRHVIEIGTAAMAAGSHALLLPMPMFFKYQQQDLQAFCAHVSRTLKAPCLLYDLPDFTNGLSAETALDLMRSEEFIVGIKDSSGREHNLTSFAHARGDQDWTLLVGDDRLLHKALCAGWNGGISGVAAFCPELLVALYQSFQEHRESEAVRLQALLDEVISRIARFPTPWGIRIALAARGLETGPLPIPLSSGRQRQIQLFQEWFRRWLEQSLITHR